MSEAGRLSGRVAIVTGGGQGVGQGIARALAREGANVVVVGRTAETLNTTVASIEAYGVASLSICGSISDRETAERSVAETLRTFGRLDILVNNAHSFTPTTALEEMPLENMKINIESGLYGTFHFMQCSFPHMQPQGGSIINLGSYVGLASTPGYGAYAATKEAIRALSRTAAREWGKYRIRVNVINPAALSPTAKTYLADHPEHLKEVNARISLGYMGDPEQDIGRVAAFLAGDDAGYLTGQTINADGGQWMF